MENMILSVYIKWKACINYYCRTQKSSNKCVYIENWLQFLTNKKYYRALLESIKKGQAQGHFYD